MPEPPEIIATDRLVLRRPKASDASAKYECSRDPEVARYMDWLKHDSVEDAVASIRSAPQIRRQSVSVADTLVLLRTWEDAARRDSSPA